MKKEKKYEYLIRENIDNFDFPENELNELGKDGWEFVGLNHKTSFTEYIFKRELTINHPTPKIKK